MASVGRRRGDSIYDIFRIREILAVLDRHGELNSYKLLKILDTSELRINQTTALRYLNFLVLNNAVEKRVKSRGRRIPSVTYVITDFGKELLSVLDRLEKPE